MDLTLRKLADFADYYGKDPAYLKMLQALEEVYDNFRNYPRPADGLTCQDNLSYDPAEVALILSYNLKELPCKLVERLEFFGDGWGTLDEVKYYLPRKLECTAIYFLHQCMKNEDDQDYYIYDNGFFTCKLSAMQSWSANEQKAVYDFIYSLFEFLVNNADNLNEFIVDYCCHLALDGESLVKIWESGPYDRKNQQFQNFVRRFLLNTARKHQQDIYIGEVNITQYVMSDAHVLEFDFFTEDIWFAIFEDYWKENASDAKKVIKG